MPQGVDNIINVGEGAVNEVVKAQEKVEALNTTLEKTKEETSDLGDVFKKAFEIAWDFGSKSLEAFKKSEAAAAQVSQGIISTGSAAGKSLSELKKKAAELGGQTLFGSDDTLMADSLLLTFTNIRGEVFDKAMPAIQDMAQRMAGDGPADLKGAAMLVGKALNNPIEGIDKLKEAGVSFSEGQEKHIETALKAGSVQEAQNSILAQLNTQFGGSAVAARQALGPMADLNDQTDDLKMAFGQLINDGLIHMAPVLTEMVHFGVMAINAFGSLSGTLQSGYEWVKKNVDIFEALGAGIAAAGAAFLVFNFKAAASATISGIVAGAKWALTTAEFAFASASETATAGMAALNAVMEANPLGVLAVGIGLVVGGFVALYNNSSTFRAVISGIGEVCSSLMPILSGLGETIKGVFTFDASLISKGLNDTASGVNKFFKDGGFSGAFDRGYKSSKAESKKKEDEEANKEKSKGEKETAHVLVGKTTPKITAPVLSVSTGVKHSGDSADASVAGNKSVRNVKIDIHKLVERLEFHTTNISGVGSADIKRQLTELLVGVVHDSELALGSQ